MKPVLGVLFCVALVSGLALDSNTIRSSKDSSVHKNSSDGNSQRSNRRGSARSQPSVCSGPDCDSPQRGSCSNRAQRRQSNRDRDQDLDSDRDADFNRTRAPEMSPCVRSRDCAPGLCCVRYLTGKRCQRIPSEGELCLLLRGSKQRRSNNLGRCECGAGLTCARVPEEQGGAGPGQKKGQGVCVVKPSGQRKTRHSGKKRRTAENSC